MVESEIGTYSPRGLEKGELLALNDTGKELVGTLEKAEASLPKTTPKASELIRATDYKMGAFEKRDSLQPHTKELYEALLEKHLKSIDKPITNQADYLESSKGLLSDLQALKTKDGQLMSHTKVDAGVMEGIEAVYDGVSKGLEVTVKELKKQLETLVSPEEWQKIVDSLVSMAKDPIHFMDLLIQGLKTEATEVWKQIEVMWKNSTNSGFSAEMGKYIPEMGIPMLIGTVGVGKFLKILGLEGLLGEKLIAKIAKLDLAKDRGKYTVKQGELFGEFLNKTEAFNKVFTIESLPTNPKNFAEAIKVMRTMTTYVIEHEKTIPGMNIEIKSQAKHNMERLVNKMTMMVDHPDFIIHRREFDTFLKGDMSKAYYILIPEGKPK